MWGRFILLFVVALPGAGQALDLVLSNNARLTREVLHAPDSYLFPIGPYADGSLPSIKAEGSLRQQAWRIEQQNLTTLQMIRPLRDQLVTAGFDVVFDCGGQECGGFDFRFGTRVMAAPDMFVDLFDYRFISAIRGADATDRKSEYVTVITSRSGATGYVQIIHVVPDGVANLTVDNTGAVTSALQSTVDTSQPVLQQLTQNGHVILADLEFQSGSSDLGEGPFSSLMILAEFLTADSNRRVALVGHTDTVGGLEPNIALSRRRATSVLERLADLYKVPKSQLEAGGMGYLAPVAPNLTPEGRRANRRVEAVLLNTE